MLLLAHHEASTQLVVLLTFSGPALLALRCWLYERKHRSADDDATKHQR